MVNLKPGQTYVPGSSARVARQLLDAASKAGLNPKLAVRTTEGGFVVPDQIAPAPSRTARILPVDPPPEPKPVPEAKPRGRRKKNTQKGT